MSEPLIEDWWEGNAPEVTPMPSWLDGITLTLDSTGSTARFAWREEFAKAVLAAFGGGP